MILCEFAFVSLDKKGTLMVRRIFSLEKAKERIPILAMEAMLNKEKADSTMLRKIYVVLCKVK